ncbi:hypothetical protein [Candidatus Synchoanobacter obligatus]|uniref:Uncharacterized protein n=1 Tax=Candidatus Synchoanobacter obligatus TaxID=2919597 RepID=A0ABT1L4X4_9GAMM|nr:hypothetical protein [Candidatus Synchoanobacter obligatus]MCP8352144.1 hypothetical protein [Candidatus Synchoanobacter obligatus]
MNNFIKTLPSNFASASKAVYNVLKYPVLGSTSGFAAYILLAVIVVPFSKPLVAGSVLVCGLGAACVSVFALYKTSAAVFSGIVGLKGMMPSVTIKKGAFSKSATAVKDAFSKAAVAVKEYFPEDAEDVMCLLLLPVITLIDLLAPFVKAVEQTPSAVKAAAERVAWFQEASRVNDLCSDYDPTQGVDRDKFDAFSKNL